MAIQINGTTVIDNSRNITNAGNGNFSGTVTASQFNGNGAGLTNLPVNAGTVNMATKYFGDSFGSGTVGTMTFTPSSSSNKLIIIFGGSMYHHTSSNRGGTTTFNLQRPAGTTLNYVNLANDQNGGGDSSNWRQYDLNMSHLDSPGTTGTVTYTFVLSGDNVYRAAASIYEVTP